MTALVCIDPKPDYGQHSVGVRLGDACTLTGFYEAHTGRGVTPGGATRLSSSGKCSLPTRAGPLPLDVANTTLSVNGSAVMVSVGGTTTDGRYMTYPFSGFLGEDAPSDECARTLAISAPP